MENSEKNTSPIEKLDEQEKKEKLSGWKKELFEWAKAIVIAVVVAFLLNTFVLRLANVKGDSMLPSLHDGEMLYVNRLFYEPQKGDIVILHPPTIEHPYVKRVIATEGETVYIDLVKGEVYVNDELIDEPYINEPTHLSGSYIEGLKKKGEYSRENPIVVEKDKVFVMGDNRNHSSDSRQIGQVAKKDIIGHAVFRFWPLNAIGGI